MRIAFASSEVVPFSKTGGLADVSGALPKALARRGHEVVVFTPLYRQAREKADLQDTGQTISVPVGGDLVEGRLWLGALPDSNVRVCLIGNEGFFDREGLYGDGEGDYGDNCSRFVFFSRGVLEAVNALRLDVDIIHSNDWQAGLVPVYCRAAYSDNGAVSRAPNVFTIHNMAYQGLFWHWDIPLTNIGWEHFNYRELEFYGKINFLKGGIVFADTITTVSPTYAKQIQADEELGAGLQDVLSDRSADLVGILNGIDYGAWDPGTDEFIAANYSHKDLAGKAACKKALQQEAGLANDVDVPLVGMISRLADQKGLDLVAEAIDEMMHEDLQLVVLGTGLEKYHKLLKEIERRYPEKSHVFLEFNNSLAHRIEAGCDMFFMPSRYEPCGLNQMFSLKYGTVPIVRATGGLADTVTDTTDKTLASGKANGFSFELYEASALLGAVRRALEAYDDKRRWAKIVRAGMQQDWSWARSAAEYEKVYRRALKKRKGTVKAAAAGKKRR